jgi:hypothetical protein
MKRPIKNINVALDSFDLTSHLPFSTVAHEGIELPKNRNAPLYIANAMFPQIGFPH